MKKLTKILGILFAITIGICLSFLLREKESHFDYEIDAKYYSDTQSIYENDFDYAFDTLEKYYGLFYRNGTYDFLKNRDTYKKELKNIRTDREFFDRMNKIFLALKMVIPIFWIRGKPTTSRKHSAWQMIIIRIL